MIKVLLADDHEIVRTILCQVLEKAGDIQVVSMASNGQDAVNEAATHCPDVAVMDVSMPIMDGVEATKQIRSKCPDTRVLMVSSYDTFHHIHRSIEAGALGYILKDVISRDLITAVRTLYQGNRYFSTQIAELAKLHI
jgi:DNA-binding NarL/FixJ family response regulator